MLGLSRRAGQSILIETSDGPVWFHISRVVDGKVNVSIAAPPKCLILRGELVGRERPSVEWEQCTNCRGDWRRPGGCDRCECGLVKTERPSTAGGAKP